MASLEVDVRRIECALGFDLGLNTGWAVVRWHQQRQLPTILACGNVDVRREDGVSARTLAWGAQVGTVAREAKERGVSVL